MLLTLLFISTAVATPLLGTEQCARGPPYWCQNVKTASLCGAVQHCQQNVWIKPQMKSVPCDLCKEVIVVVEQLLKDNGTESEILGYIEKVCHLIPDTGLAGQCQDIVDNYFPILMGIIEGELDNPSVVCGAMGLCVSQQAALAKALLMSNEIPQVDLTQRVNPFLLNIPQLLYPKENVKEETPKQSGDVCQDCVTFITDTQDQAKSNASFVNSLLMQVENQCELLGPGMSDMCKEYISQYGPLVIQQLMSMQPKDICFRAGFCPTGPKSVLMQKLVPAKSIPASKSIPAVKMFPAIKLETPVVAKKMMRVRDPPQCAICEYVIKEVEAMLEGQTSEEQIVQVVEKVCNILPSTLTTQCKDLIEAYGKAIIDLLVQEADPKTICGFLGLCNQASRTFIPEMDIAKFQNGGLCDVCKMAVRYMDGIMEQNATQAEIEDAVRKVCKFLPDSVRDECDQLVQQYEPLLVQLLLQTLDPDFICMKLGACPGAVQRLLGLEQCSWGPGYWCKNMETAARCNALDHCRRHVWN